MTTPDDEQRAFQQWCHAYRQVKGYFPSAAEAWQERARRDSEPVGVVRDVNLKASYPLIIDWVPNTLPTIKVGDQFFIRGKS